MSANEAPLAGGSGGGDAGLESSADKENEVKKLDKDWWQTFDFSEGASFEVQAENDWWQVNSRRWQGDDVLVRYVGGDPADDFWVQIDSDQVRPSQVPAGNEHGQVGNLVMVLFLVDGTPKWYQGEIQAYSFRSPEEGKPEQWMFTIDFDDEESPQYFKLPDPEVRLYIPQTDVLDALQAVRSAAHEAFEDYANKRELHRALIANINVVIQSVYSECEKNTKSRFKDLDACTPHKPMPHKVTETNATREFLSLLRSRVVKDDLLQAREWTMMSKLILPPPRPMGPNKPSSNAPAATARSAAGPEQAPVDNVRIKISLPTSAANSYICRNALVEVELGPEHGFDERLWEIGRLVSVNEEEKEVGVNVNGATVDVAVDRVRPVGGGGWDVPVMFNGSRAWVRSCKDGKYQLLLDGDDMSKGSTEGEWVDCLSSDIRIDSELPVGRSGEAVQVKRKGKWVAATVTGVNIGTNEVPPSLSAKVSGSGTELSNVNWATTHVKRIPPVITKGKRPGGGHDGPVPKRIRLTEPVLQELQGESGGGVAAGEDVLLETNDYVSDEMLNWMTVKAILGVRVECPGGSALEEHGARGASDVSIKSASNNAGGRLEYLVRLSANEDLKAMEAYPPGGMYVAADGEKVSTIAQRFGVNLSKLLYLNSDIAGLRAGSKLLDGTVLVLPPRPHLRWMAHSNVSTHAGFNEMLVEMLERAAAPANTIVHPAMPNASDLIQVWLDKGLFPADGRVNEDGSDASRDLTHGVTAQRKVTGIKLPVKEGSSLFRLSLHPVGQRQLPIDLWMPMHESWHHDVAVFLLHTVGAVSTHLGRTRCMQLLKASGLLAACKINPHGDSMAIDDTDAGYASSESSDGDGDDDHPPAGRVKPNGVNLKPEVDQCDSMQIDGSSEDLSKQAATASATGRGKDVESGEEGEQGDSSVPSMSAAAFSPETRGGRGKAGGLEGARGDEGDNRAQAGSGREGKGKESDSKGKAVEGVGGEKVPLPGLVSGLLGGPLSGASARSNGVGPGSGSGGGTSKGKELAGGGGGSSKGKEVGVEREQGYLLLRGGTEDAGLLNEPDWICGRKIGGGTSSRSVG